MSIHPTALVADPAGLAEDVAVGPYAILEAGVAVEPGSRIAAHAILRRGTSLGSGVRVDSFAVIGGEPQATAFDPATESGVRIGDEAVIREGCTIHRSMEPGGTTTLEDGVLLMAQAHVAHDCRVEAGTVLCNNVMLGGYVTVGARAFIGGGAAVHQFCRVGTFAMIGGNASISADVPPYILATERNRAHGLNLVGLRRAGFEQREIGDLKRCFRAVFLGGGSAKRRALEAIREHEFGNTAVGTRFLSFFETGNRGFVQAAGRDD